MLCDPLHTDLSQQNMLSLKHARPQPSVRLPKTLIDVPDEILDSILQYVYYSGGEYLTSIVPLSRTCRRLRTSTYPFLFGRFTVKANADIIEKRSWECLQNLVGRPHLMSYTKCLEIRAAVKPRELPSEVDITSARVGQLVSRKRLMECLRMMTGLRSVKLHYLSDMTIDVLEHLADLETLQVSIRLRSSKKCLNSHQCQRLTQILAKPGWTSSVSLSATHDEQKPEDIAMLVSSSRVNSIDWCDNASALNLLIEKDHKLPDLEELHISSKVLQVQDRLLTTGFIPWPYLKRLHVDGDRQIKHFLSSIVDELLNLEDLQLHASTTDAFHDDCLDTSRRLPREPLSYTHLPRLKHLSLRGICPHIHAQYLTTPTLESLSLVLPEYHARLRNLNQIRTPNELKWMANNLPHLTHLETHIGPLENLWHPTAIPGVEVNVEVYAALQAITHIPNLSTLRLFPPYVPRSAGHDYLNARQPLSDEQAIRVFRRLHGSRPSLHTLSIAATFYTLRGFQPMSWLVRADGGPSKTVMSTRQAGKDYELEQTWLGERRSRMMNRRHSYTRPYLPDLRGGWTFPVEDPPAV